VVENIAGGSMNIGAGQVARAAPDGYTLFVAPPAPLALAHLVNKINYNRSTGCRSRCWQDRQRAVGSKHAPRSTRSRS